MIRLAALDMDGTLLNPEGRITERTARTLKEFQNSGGELLICTGRSYADAVEPLEEPDRTLFLRHYYANEKLRDVARDLGMNQATARTRLHRGRRLLREQLTKGGDDL